MTDIVSFDRQHMTNNIEGYWSSLPQDTDAKYPFPVAHQEKWAAQDEFVIALQQIETKAKITQAMGYSRCRLCAEKKRNGSSEFELNGVRWPEGYLHYIRDHNVKPSKEFYEFVVQQKHKGKNDY